MSAKKIYFLFKLMILRRNGGFEKNQINLPQPLRRNKPPQNYINFSAPTLQKKILAAPHLKDIVGRLEIMKHGVVPRDFLHIPVHRCTAYLSGSEGQPPWFRLLEAPFPKLVLKSLGPKFGQQYLFIGTKI